MMHLPPEAAAAAELVELKILLFCSTIFYLVHLVTWYAPGLLLPLQLSQKCVCVFENK